MVVIAAAPIRVGSFGFVGQPWRAQAAVASTAAILLLVATARGRRRLRLPYAAWRILHAGLAVTAIRLAVVPTIGWNRYLMAGVPFLGPVPVAAVSVLPIASLRIRRHGRLRRTGYRVDSVVRERGGATTLNLRADGHGGHDFRPGQFAWIKPAEGRSRVDEHPFSYASSAEHPTGRASPSGGRRASARPWPSSSRGGASSSTVRTAASARHRRAGPRADRQRHRVTPMMSILRTAAERGDRRSFILIYGNRDGGASASATSSRS